MTSLAFWAHGATLISTLSYSFHCLVIVNPLPLLLEHGSPRGLGTICSRRHCGGHHPQAENLLRQRLSCGLHADAAPLGFAVVVAVVD